MQHPSVHLPTVAPGLAPGGIWVRVCTDDEWLVTEYALLDSFTASNSAEADAQLAIAALDRHIVVRVYFYDGDSGLCLKTIIAKPRDCLLKGESLS